MFACQLHKALRETPALDVGSGWPAGVPGVLWIGQNLASIYTIAMQHWGLLAADTGSIAPCRLGIAPSTHHFFIRGIA